MAETARVLREAGAQRLHEWRLRAHRIAIWETFPNVPDAALEVLLRHELEHARRWCESGTAFFDADEELRAAIVRDAEAYGRLPTEFEANAASTAYAAENLRQIQIDALRRLPAWRDLVSTERIELDVVSRTFQELEALDKWRPNWSAEQRREYIERAREATAAWEPEVAEILGTGDGPWIEFVGCADT